MTHNTLISSVYNSVFHLHQYSKIISLEISYLLHTPLTAQCGLHICGTSVKAGNTPGTLSKVREACMRRAVGAKHVINAFIMSEAVPAILLLDSNLRGSISHTPQECLHIHI